MLHLLERRKAGKGAGVPPLQLGPEKCQLVLQLAAGDVHGVPAGVLADPGPVVPVPAAVALFPHPN
jgi:hypothetical protein